MRLNSNEYTFETLVDYLVKNYTNKSTGEDFNKSDIAQYLIRGRLPRKYGGNKIAKASQHGISIITMSMTTAKVEND
tara:strand:+ start:1448 stop:1678 length:231 start_codon:yes stop_codon:yes gene_type:complete